MLGFRQYVAAAEADDFRAAFRNENTDRGRACGEHFFPQHAAFLDFHRVEIRLRNHAAVGFSPAIDTDSRDRLRVAGAGGPDDDRGDITAHRGGGDMCAHGAPEFAACTASIVSAQTLSASNALSATEVLTDGDRVAFRVARTLLWNAGWSWIQERGRRARMRTTDRRCCKGVKLSPSHRIWAIIASLAGSVHSSRPSGASSLCKK